MAENAGAIRFSGSAQQSDERQAGTAVKGGCFVDWRRDEQRLDEDPGVARLRGVPDGDSGRSEGAEVVGAAEARQAGDSMLGLWSAVSGSGRH